MKRFSAGALLLALANISQAAQFTGHYPAGAEGIKGASLPPAGVYLRDYNFFYTANINKDSGLADFDAFAYVNAPRVIWMTDYTIPYLKAQYGMDLLIPFYYSNVKLKVPGGTTLKDDTFAMGDLQFEPLLLSWHWKKFDMGAGYAFWAPSGDSNTDGTHFARMFGRGYWGHMLTWGATWYPTEDKSWALSVLNRYEINMENKDFKVTPGNAYTLEWGLSKVIRENVTVGLVGYYQQQITSDRGDGTEVGGYDTSLHDRVFAAGPEISTFCPKLGLFTSLRYLREFGAKDGPEGHKVVLTLTKRW